MEEIAKDDRALKVDRLNQISIKQQCGHLDICRSSFYYIPQNDSSQNQEPMKLIDKQYMETPFYGVPRMVEYLRELGHRVNPKRIRRLYRLMDLHAIEPRPNIPLVRVCVPPYFEKAKVWARHRLQIGARRG